MAELAKERLPELKPLLSKTVSNFVSKGTVKVLDENTYTYAKGTFTRGSDGKFTRTSRGGGLMGDWIGDYIDFDSTLHPPPTEVLQEDPSYKLPEQAVNSDASEDTTGTNKNTTRKKRGMSDLRISGGSGANRGVR